MASRVFREIYVPPHLRAKHRQSNGIHSDKVEMEIPAPTATEHSENEKETVELLAPKGDETLTEVKSFVQEYHAPEVQIDIQPDKVGTQNGNHVSGGVRQVKSEASDVIVKRLEEAEEHMMKVMEHFQAYLALKNKPGDWSIGDGPTIPTSISSPGEVKKLNSTDSTNLSSASVHSNPVPESSELKNQKDVATVKKPLSSEENAVEEKSSPEVEKPVTESSVHSSDLGFLNCSEQDPNHGFVAWKNSQKEADVENTRKSLISETVQSSQGKTNTLLAAPAPHSLHDIKKFLDQQVSITQPGLTQSVNVPEDDSSLEFIKDQDRKVQNVADTFADTLKLIQASASSTKPSSSEHQSTPRGLPRNTRGRGFVSHHPLIRVPTRIPMMPHNRIVPHVPVIVSEGHKQLSGDDWDVEGTIPGSSEIVKERPVKSMHHSKYLIRSTSTLSSGTNECSGFVSKDLGCRLVYDAGTMRIEDMDAEQAKIYKVVNSWRHNVDKCPNGIVGHEALQLNTDSDIAPVKWFRNHQIEGLDFRHYYFQTRHELLEYDMGDFDQNPYWEKFKGINSSFLLPLDVPDCALDSEDLFFDMAKAAPTSNESAYEYLEEERVRQKERKVAEQIYRYGMRLATPDSNRPPKTYIESDTDGWGPEPTEVGRHKAACRNEIYKSRPKEFEIEQNGSAKSSQVQLVHPLHNQPVELDNILDNKDSTSQSMRQHSDGIKLSVDEKKSETNEEGIEIDAKEEEEEARALRVLTSRRRDYDLRVANIEKDVLQIQNIYNRSIKGGPNVAELKEQTLCEIVKRMGDAVNETMPWIVAVTNKSHSFDFPIDTVIGFGYVIRRTKDKDMLFSELGQLQIVIDLKWRSAGVGTALLQQMSNMVQPLYNFDSAVTFLGDRPSCMISFRMLVVDCFYFETDDPSDRFSRFSRLKRWMKNNRYQLIGSMKNITKKHNTGVNCAIFQLDCRPDAYR